MRESNRLFYNEIPVPVMLRSPPGICLLPLPFPGVSLPFLSPSFFLGLCGCLSRTIFLGPRHSCALSLWLVSVGSLVLPARPRSLRGAQGSPANSTHSLEGYLPPAGFPSAWGSACGPLASPIRLCPEALSHLAFVSLSAHRLGSPPAVEGTDRLLKRSELLR